MSSMTDAISARLQMEILRPFTVARGIIQSGAAQFPIQGVIYFFQNPQLWPLYLRMVPPILIVHVSVFLSVFSTLFLLNVSAAMCCCGPFGLLVGAGITAQEANFITSYILDNYLIPRPMDSLFDTVLCQEGMESVVIPGKLKRVVGPSFGDRLWETSLWTTVTFPSDIYSTLRPVGLSFIPVFGPMALSFNGAVAKGNSFEKRFYRLSRLRGRQVKYLIKEREGDYWSFGFVANILESVPLLGTFFYFTNQIGGALLAVKYYQEGRTQF
ncbi:hypothetical protein OGAPHI_005493 [Ogataea philodendri]|uniref:Outer spore wall protein RRT8 n=1 Tax=Ogataea philodendri TaxID=1378263 RepID=A0A9P8NZA3_9ASCO|nr:uncharacterized protein OGAPHI_005493 [Ogataea philodendri]KAH3662245.1 hypothetical protein OGAPHI_005493 [Ogataea philodendri]